MAGSVTQATGKAEFEDGLNRGNQSGARNRFQRLCTITESNAIMDSMMETSGLGFSVGTQNSNLANFCGLKYSCFWGVRILLANVIKNVFSVTRLITWSVLPSKPD